MTFQESISKAIESQRNRLGITATELSKRLGISRQYLKATMPCGRSSS